MKSSGAPTRRFSRTIAHARDALARHVLAVTFCICVAGIVGTGGVSFYLFERSQQSDVLVLNAAVRIGRLERLHLALVEAESAGRAFLVFATPAARTAYDSTIADADDQLREYRQLVAGDAAQDRSLAELEQHIARRFAYLEALMSIRAGKGLDAMLRTSIGAGRQEMQWIKGRIDGMKATQNQLLEEQRAAQSAHDAHLQLALALFVTLGVAVLGTLFWYMKRLWVARQRAEAAAVHEPHHDALTGLANRRLLHDRMNVAIARAARDGTHIGILSMDLDGFKHVNDTYGHDAGDELLRQVAARLARLVRTEDTVARMGGDEFVLSLVPVRDAGEVKMIAARIGERLSAPYAINGSEVSIGASVGAALYPRDGLTEEELLKRADLALYAAKNRRRATARVRAAAEELAA